MGQTTEDDGTPKILLGNRVSDKITKATGIAVARSEHLFGCTHIHVKQEVLDDKGRPYDSIIVDLARCEFVADAYGIPDIEPPSPGLGEHVHETVTGFEGIICVTTQFMNGQTDCCVEARELTEGKPVLEWFNAKRLTTIATEEKTVAPYPRGPGASTVSLPRT